MKFHHLIKYFPLGVAIAFTLVSIISVMLLPAEVEENGNIIEYAVSNSIWLGALGLFFVLILVPFKGCYWSILFLILLLLAHSSLIQFYSTTYTIGFGWLRYNVMLSSLLILHVTLNLESIKEVFRILGISKVIKAIFYSVKTSEEELIEQRERHIKSFQRRFTSKSPKELQRIVNENALVPEAVEAANRLLQK